LITGACGGIGRATARRLAEASFRLILVDQPKEKYALRQLAEQTNAEPLDLDLTRPNSDGALVACLKEHGQPLNALIHCAGICRDRLFKNMSPREWQSVLDTNLWAPIHLTKACLNASVFADHARIVLLSSVMALSGNRGQTQYCLAKAALIGFMQDLAPNLLHKGISINTIAPGFIDTAMTRKMPKGLREMAKRINVFAQAGQAEDVAEAIAMCCHPNTEAFSGNILRVCGLMPNGR
jgi:3-oxoacyl-[acyl-carrier protein] reductase